MIGKLIYHLKMVVFACFCKNENCPRLIFLIGNKCPDLSEWVGGRGVNPIADPFHFSAQPGIRCNPK